MKGKEKNRSVSVIIPFKGEKNRKQLLSSMISLQKQTIKPYEIIVVSGDRGLKVPRGIQIMFAEVDKNEARNLGISKSKGKYILYLDHDMTADSNLIENCLKLSKEFDAIIVPEKGAGGNFLEDCKKLEKEFISFDIHTVTPRFYRKNIFSWEEKPFDDRFGLLDEWGFNHKLLKRKVKVGYSSSYLTVKESDLNLPTEIANKFKRGMWMKNFYNIDRQEARRRVDPIKRGVVFYFKRLNYVFVNPTVFMGLIFLKIIDFTSFMMGYVFGYLVNPQTFFQKSDTLVLYDRLSYRYLTSMYQKNSWSRYINHKEMKIVDELLSLLDNQNFNKEKILDLGMGPGRWSKHFVEKGFAKVIGMDISNEMVKVAKKYVNSPIFSGVQGDMSNLVFPANYFDKIFCFRAFKYSEIPEKVLQEVYRVIKPKGKFLLEVSNNTLINKILSSMSHIVVALYPKMSVENRWRYYLRARFYTDKEITTLLNSCGFKLQVIKPFLILPSVPLPFTKKDATIWILIDKILFSILPKGLFARSWIIVAKK